MAGTAKVDVQLKRTVLQNVISRDMPVNEEVHYQLYTLQGKLVYSKSIIMINAGEKITETIDVSHLPVGTFELVIISRDQVLENRVVTI